MKVKTDKNTYELTDIRENTEKELFAYYNYYTISINKEPRNKTYYVQCSHPNGSYIYDGYFHGTRSQALKDVFENIEFCIEEDDDEEEEVL